MSMVSCTLWRPPGVKDGCCVCEKCAAELKKIDAWPQVDEKPCTEAAHTQVTWCDVCERGAESIKVNPDGWCKPPRMRSIEEIRATHEKLSSEQLKREIDRRSDLIGVMVGSLYPSILSGEISEIRDMRAAALRREAPKT